MTLGHLIRRVMVIGLAVAVLAGCSSQQANPELRHRVNVDATPTESVRTSIFELAEFDATGPGRHGAEPLREAGSSIFARAHGAGAEKRDYSRYRWFLVRLPHSPRLWVMMNNFELSSSMPPAKEAHDSFESWSEAEWYLTVAAGQGRVHAWNDPGPVWGTVFVGFSESELSRREADGRWVPPRAFAK